MAAPTDDRTAGERTRERILHEALPLFARFGYDGTSVRAIASAADVNVATLAYHFGDKAGLYHTLVTRLYVDLATLDLSDVAHDDDLPGAVIRRIWRFVLAREQHIRLLHRHMLDHGRHTEQAEGPAVAPLLERADAIIGLLRPDAPIPERRLILFSVIHLMVRFALEPDAVYARQYAITDDPRAAVEDWLVVATGRLMGIGGR